MLEVVHQIPILTTILSAIFCYLLIRRYWSRPGSTHLLVWAIGMFCYGAGTALESIVYLYGNSFTINKLWYVFGAILGGYPLAQGSVYLHLSRRTAHLLSAVTLPIIVGLSLATMFSPVIIEEFDPTRPRGALLGWQWIRYGTPIINMYAAVFLIGSALRSAIQFSRSKETAARAFGNACIAFGALLPGIGGALAKADMVEALYVGEFVGLNFMMLGYYACTLRKTHRPAMVEEKAERLAA